MAEEIGTVIVCRGPPVCGLEGDEAVSSAEAGCPLCKRIVVMSDGTEREEKAKTN